MRFQTFATPAPRRVISFNCFDGQIFEIICWIQRSGPLVLLGSSVTQIGWAVGRQRLIPFKRILILHELILDLFWHSIGFSLAQAIIALQIVRKKKANSFSRRRRIVQTATYRAIVPRIILKQLFNNLLLSGLTMLLALGLGLHLEHLLITSLALSFLDGIVTLGRRNLFLQLNITDLFLPLGRNSLFQILRCNVQFQLAPRRNLRNFCLWLFRQSRLFKHAILPRRHPKFGRLVSAKHTGMIRSILRTWRLTRQRILWSDFTQLFLCFLRCLLFHKIHSVRLILNGSKRTAIEHPCWIRIVRRLVKFPAKGALCRKTVPLASIRSRLPRNAIALPHR